MMAWRAFVSAVLLTALAALTLGCTAPGGTPQSVEKDITEHEDEA